VPHSLADISRARKDLQYDPAVDLREGLTRTLAYYGLLHGPGHDRGRGAIAGNARA
jgi:nucleoside-diphosphate-sugar epimerase